MVLSVMLLVVACALTGCWFVYIPSGLFTSSDGAVCVADWAQVGAKIKLTDGREGVVTSLRGRSERCQDGRFPILADLDTAIR